jgi:hypothetical protein
MQRSSESARAAEVEQSSPNPRRLRRTSWRTSKLVFGGGACRLQTYRVSLDRRENTEEDSPQDGRLRELLVNPLRDADVGEQHELLDETVRLVHRLLFDIDGVGRLGRLHVDLDLGGREIESSSGHSLRSELDGDRVEQSDAFSERIGERPGAEGVRYGQREEDGGRTYRLCESGQLRR